jgi:hypothetical protein
MNDRLLIERLSAEIEKATVAGDHARARKLADLQLEVLAGLMRDIAAEPTTESMAVTLTSRPAIRKSRQAAAR